jgi:hypothetical protein
VYKSNHTALNKNDLSSIQSEGHANEYENGNYEQDEPISNHFEEEELVEDMHDKSLISDNYGEDIIQDRSPKK